MEQHLLKALQKLPSCFHAHGLNVRHGPAALPAVTLGRLHREGIAVIEPDDALIVDDRRVMGQITQIGAAVRVADKAVILIRPGGRVADRHADGCIVGVRYRLGSAAADAVVEIIPPIVASHHIGCIEVAQFSLYPGVLLCFEYHAFTAPVAQVVHRSAPAYIVALLAVAIAALFVVGSVEIDPPVKNMRLAVRHRLPQREEGIVNLLSHTSTSFQKNQYCTP